MQQGLKQWGIVAGFFDSTAISSGRAPGYIPAMSRATKVNTHAKGQRTIIERRAEGCGGVHYRRSFRGRASRLRHRPESLNLTWNCPLSIPDSAGGSSFSPHPPSTGSVPTSRVIDGFRAKILSIAAWSPCKHLRFTISRGFFAIGAECL